MSVTNRIRKLAKDAGGEWKKSGGDRFEWFGLDCVAKNGHLLRITQDGKDGPVEAYIFDDDCHNVCCGEAEFGPSIPDEAVVAFIRLRQENPDIFSVGDELTPCQFSPAPQCTS